MLDWKKVGGSVAEHTDRTWLKKIVTKINKIPCQTIVDLWVELNQEKLWIILVVFLMPKKKIEK